MPATEICTSDDGARRGPTTSQSCTRWSAIQFSMIVLMTSCTPRRTLSQAAMSAHAAPADIAPAAHSASSSGAGRSTACPSHAAASAPTVNCPSAPMLKTPALSPTATESPVSVSTAALMDDSPSAAGLPSAYCAR